MGVQVSKHSNSKGEVKSLSLNVSRSSHRSSSIIEYMKPECMKKRNTNTKKKKKPMKMTLGDCLLASPDPKGSNPNSLVGGEFYVFKNFSKRVYRSTCREHKKYVFSSELCSRDDVSGSSYRRNQSGRLKKKKKVSFKLPEEGDVVVFYSAAEKFESE